MNHPHPSRSQPFWRSRIGLAFLGLFAIADFYRPANPLWWLVAWPFLYMPMTADNFRGTLPDYIREAGFDPVQGKGRRAGILTFWCAIKP